MKLKKNKRLTMFSSKESRLASSYSVKNNFCLFTLNVPWSYHEVSKYYGKKDRKYFYAVYDFPIEEVGSNIKNRKKVLIKIHFGPQKLIEVKKKKKNFFSE